MTISQPIPPAVLAQHVSVLGKTGSGKTSTAKLLVEQAFDAGDRICILDPIKSDWWGLISSADGKSAGLPFAILGGPHGHVGLKSSAGAAIGRLVGHGDLPHTIIDMADMEPGGLQRFFCDFAPALMKAMRGVLYLVIEEAHEFAPKERAGFGGENMALHYAKKLATAGRSKGIRLIVATQRVQSLHNAVLGSCETIIAHRLTTPADQKPVVDWLTAHAGKTQAVDVGASLSSLPTGEGWIASGEARIFERRAFPKFRTFDNAATPTRNGGKVHVHGGAIDAAALREKIGEAASEIAADDPKALRKEIDRLGKELSDNQKSFVAASKEIQQPDPKAIEEADLRGYMRGRDSLLEPIRVAVEKLEQLRADATDLADASASVITWLNAVSENIDASAQSISDRISKAVKSVRADVAPPVIAGSLAQSDVRRARPAAAPGSTTGPQAHVLRALRWWRAMGKNAPTRAQVAAICGWKVTSGHLKNVLGSLSSSGLVTYPEQGRVGLTGEGFALAPEPETGANVIDGIRSTLTGPQRQMFDVLLKHRRPITRDDLAAALGWAPTSGHLKNVAGSMRTLDIIDYPQQGTIALASWVRE